MLAFPAHQAHPVAGTDLAVHDPHEQHHSPEGVVLGVEDERAERVLEVAAGRRDSRDDRVEDLLDALPLLRRGEYHLERIESEFLVDLLPHPLRIRGRQVDLVDHRHHGQVVFHRHEVVGDGLRLHPLRRVHQQQGSVAGHQRTPHFVGEIHVAGSVDQIELIGVPVRRLVKERDAVRLDGDSAFALEVHRIQELVAELAVADAPAALDQPVG